MQEYLADLSETFGSGLDELLDEHGWQLSIHTFTIAANGSALFGLYTPAESGLSCVILFRQVMGQGFAVPINITFFDAGGEGARILLAKDHQPTDIEMLN